MIQTKKVAKENYLARYCMIVCLPYKGSAKRWKKFVDSECPEKEKFPQEWKNKNSLQKLCMMRALRPDRMTYAVMWVAYHLLQFKLSVLWSPHAYVHYNSMTIQNVHISPNTCLLCDFHCNEARSLVGYKDMVLKPGFSPKLCLIAFCKTMSRTKSLGLSCSFYT